MQFIWIQTIYVEMLHIHQYITNILNKGFNIYFFKRQMSVLNQRRTTVTRIVLMWTGVTYVAVSKATPLTGIQAVVLVSTIPFHSLEVLRDGWYGRKNVKEFNAFKYCAVFGILGYFWTKYDCIFLLFALPYLFCCCFITFLFLLSSNCCLFDKFSKLLIADRFA